MKDSTMSLEEALITVIHFVNRYRYYWIGALIGGILLGIGINQFPKSYETSFSIQSQAISPEVLEQVIASANQALEQDNYDYITETADCGNLSLSNLSDLRGKLASSTDQQGVTHFILNISATFSDPENSSIIEQCILSFIENNPLIKRQAEIYRATTSEALNRIDVEIEELNRMQVDYQKILASDSRIPLGIYANGSYQDMLNLLQYRTELQTNTQYQSAIQLVSSAFKPNNPTIGWLKSQLIGILTFFFIITILTFILELGRISRNHSETESN